jgi:hypothetical protein
MFIQRNWERTEHDDYVLNVEPRLKDSTNEAVPIYQVSLSERVILGWHIQRQYE